MLPSERELAAFKFLDGLNAHLKDVREPQKALRHALRDTREFFQATHGCIATLQAGRLEADLLFTFPKEDNWNRDVLTRFIRNMHPRVQSDMLIAPLRRRRGAWGAIALTRPGRPYDRHDGRLLVRIAAALSDAIHRIDRDRMLGVRDKIDRKIMEHIHPKDLFYQILDGLRSLTHYHHSSALLIRAAADSGRTALIIADVSGHGVSAAMLTGIVTSAFHASHVDGYEPLAVVHRIWTGLAAFSPERFVTLFAALIAPDERRLRYVNAGHPSSILWNGVRDPVW